MNRRAALGLPLALGLSGPARAQAPFPTRSIRLVVGFAAGGPTDVIGRLIAQDMSATLGQPVIVENRTGANGMIAVEYVVRSRPDGYTLLTASASQMVMLPALAQLSVNPATDIAPISIVGSNPQVLAVSARLGVNNLQEFLAYMRANPGVLNYSSGGNGSSNHLAMELLLNRTGTRATHVPYRGGAPAMQAVLAGDVGAYFGNPSDIIPHLGGPAIRVIGIAGPERMAQLPGVPTIAEQGLPGFQAQTWNGIAAPAGTPPELVARMGAILVSACQDAAFKAAVERLGAIPVCSTPDQMRAQMQADGPQWQELVRVAGLRLE